MAGPIGRNLAVVAVSNGSILKVVTPGECCLVFQVGIVVVNDLEEARGSGLNLNWILEEREESIERPC
jgi:hypothetical protein